MIRKPDIGTVSSPPRLLGFLVEVYDELRALRGNLVPSRSPVLKQATAATHAQLRAIVGHVDGEAGPRVCIVAGDVTVLDGGEGAYVWDPDSTLTDNNTTVIQPQGLTRGRWRKATL